MTNLMNATANELATIAFNAYFDDDLTTSEFDDFIAEYDSISDAIDADLDDLLKNRNECDLFPLANDLNEIDAELFFNRIYRTALFDDMIDILSKMIANAFLSRS